MNMSIALAIFSVGMALAYLGVEFLAFEQAKFAFANKGAVPPGMLDTANELAVFWKRAHFLSIIALGVVLAIEAMRMRKKTS
ncbi:MAG: hypothetical protein AAFZ09_19165 [Pseudomonadota bacterium]